jgi:hypothetical protein
MKAWKLIRQSVLSSHVIGLAVIIVWLKDIEEP